MYDSVPSHTAQRETYRARVVPQNLQMKDGALATSPQHKAPRRVGQAPVAPYEIVTMMGTALLVLGSLAASPA